MSDHYKWRKIKKNDIDSARGMLACIEDNYVSACAKFLNCEISKDPIWILSSKEEKFAGFVINSKSTILPVFRGRKEIPNPDFLKGLMRAKLIHSVQGLKDEVQILEGLIEKTGRLPADIIDYDLMNLKKIPEGGGGKSKLPDCPNLVLRTPGMTDVDEMTPLQAAYELEEVIPKGSSFNPAASRVNIANLIAGGRILAAEVDGRLVGKINVNAVSFTRYQVGGVYVEPKYRGRGIAKKMAAQFITSLINDGKGVTLFVKKTNDAARRLYSGLGFSKSKDYRITYY